MKKEIIDWYSERYYQPQKVINAGKRYGLSQAQIEAAMVYCYYKIMSGKKVSDIDVARYVFNVAKDVDASAYEKRLEASFNAEKKLRDAKETMYASWAFIGILNLLAWLFLLNWR